MRTWPPEKLGSVASRIERQSAVASLKVAPRGKNVSRECYVFATFGQLSIADQWQVIDRLARPERFELPTLRFEVAQMILPVLSFQLVSRPALSRIRHRSV